MIPIAIMPAAATLAIVRNSLRVGLRANLRILKYERIVGPILEIPSLTLSAVLFSAKCFTSE